MFGTAAKGQGVPHCPSPALGGLFSFSAGYVWRRINGKAGKSGLGAAGRAWTINLPSRKCGAARGANFRGFLELGQERGSSRGVRGASRTSEKPPRMPQDGLEGVRTDGDTCGAFQNRAKGGKSVGLFSHDALASISFGFFERILG